MGVAKSEFIGDGPERNWGTFYDFDYTIFDWTYALWYDNKCLNAW